MSNEMEEKPAAKKGRRHGPGPKGELCQARIANHKKRALQALEKNLGNISKACKEAKISRKQFYEWAKEEEFKEQIKEAGEVALDFVEDQAIERIKGIKNAKGNYIVHPSDTMIIFYLKTKGKSRGYVERMEVTDPGKQDSYDNMSLEELMKEREKRLNEKE